MGKLLIIIGISLTILGLLWHFNEKLGIAYCIYGIAGIYRVKRDYIKSLDYYKRALKISKQMNHKLGVGTNYDAIGTVYIDKRNFDKALYYHKQAFKIRSEIGDKNGLCACLGNIGIIYNYKGFN